MLELRAPAKINWFLFVTDRRTDGFHNISSLMQCVSIYDTLRFEKYDSIEVSTESPIPLENNLVYKAIIALKNKCMFEDGVRITLKKEIPLSSGMGGGSSDAASTLKGLNSLWDMGLSNEELSRISVPLGFDVPFFFKSPCALAEGRGEILRNIEMKKPYNILLLNPLVQVPTGLAYSLVKEFSKPNNVEQLINAIREGDFDYVKKHAMNGLEQGVMKEFPDIGELKDRLYKEGALYASMSGSGATMFGVFENEEKAINAEKRIPAKWSRIVKNLV